MKNKQVCIVAILKDEDPFLDEWLVYHRYIGIDHFFLYDDDPNFPVYEKTEPHRDYVTVINWHGLDENYTGRFNQTKAYTHALKNYLNDFKWVAFIDLDEFIVLKKFSDITGFLSCFEDCSSISLNWHVFGHNGFFDDPPDLITSSLTRRMFIPSKNVKSITKPSTIRVIESPHICRLKFGKGTHVDANKMPFNDKLYIGKTDVANINHYQCRSFKNWMNRVSRGDVNFKPQSAPSEQKWRLNYEACLKQFVTTVAKDKNEHIDEYMLKYRNVIQNMLKDLKR